MDKETLSNYGWIVICVLVLAVMLALATPFGTFVADGFKATYTGLFQTGDNALDVGLSAVGVSNKLPCGHGRKEAGDHTQKECGHYSCQDTDCGCVPASCGVKGHWSGDGLDHTTVVNHSDHTYACQCSGWVVPEGATYKQNGTGIWTEGQTMPCSYAPRANDKLTTKDYTYEYRTTAGNYGYYDAGWCVTGVLDKTKNTYEPIYEYICNQPVTSLYQTFSTCTNLVTAPAIPKTTTNMYYTFSRCTSLTTVPTLDGCINLERMFGAFSNCPALVDVSQMNIPSSVWDFKNVFEGCSSLEKTPNFSNATGIRTMVEAFEECASLVVAPDLSNCTSLVDIYDLFFKCTSLKSAVIPKTVTTTNQAFWGCTSLESIIIPKEVTKIGGGAFSSCQNLKDIYYTGTEEEWNAITFSYSKPTDYGAIVHYNYTGE